MVGREHEFGGIAFIAVGVLLGMAMYLDLAGPLGRGVETVVGWLTGIGRFLVPVALVAIGVALIRKGRSAAPVPAGHRMGIARAVAARAAAHRARPRARSWPTSTRWDAPADGSAR